MPIDLDREEFYHQNFKAERELLRRIRLKLVDKNASVAVPQGLAVQFNPDISMVYITLFQEGKNSIRWGSRRKTLAGSIENIANKLSSHPAFADFDVANPAACRIMYEIVTEEHPCSPQQTTIFQLSENRLEPGIHGLKFQYNNTTFFYMPTDAVTNSLMSMNQVYNFLSKRTGISKKTNRISERVKLMRSLPGEYKLIRSFACITSGEEILPLYRGFPVPVRLDLETLRQCTLKSIDWILEYMKPNGQFLYYYDGITDSEVDFQHPRMKNPTYYNILRHSGGTISLLRAYELTGDDKYLAGARASIDFLLTVFREHEYRGSYACYPFFNKKSKLGGAGIALVALVHYSRLSGDTRFRKYCDGLVYHILSRVSDTGELIGYFIHPSFYGGREIIDPDEEVKKELFSFYYPGEALLGLALYLLHVPDIDPALQSLVLEKSRMALDFLVHERPRKYPYMFQSLPSDGWLMQAIEEWVKIEGFADQAYIDFVFNDAQAMIDHMYQENDSPFFDYVGAYYYHYGEHAYPDGARCEGLIAAYYLAAHLGDEQRAAHFMTYIQKAAKNLLYTFNTPESTFAHKKPAKSMHSFRFKFTRQWVRVDSVQHAACFYARLLPVFKTPSRSDPGLLPEPGIPEGFKEIKPLGLGGFATVSLVQETAAGGRKYALKKLINSRNHYHRLIREISALKIVNGYDGAIQFYFARRIGNDIFLLFDYAPEGDLKEQVRKNGVPPENMLTRLVRDIGRELHFIHQHNLLHLDITNQNIIFYNNRYSLIDWGLSNFGPLVRTVIIKGNKVFLPPEIYIGQRSFPADIYSLGCTLYYAATGSNIFDLRIKSTPLEQKMFKHFYLPPYLPESIPAKIRYLLIRMLDKNPITRATLPEIESILQDDFTVPTLSFPYNPEDEKIDLGDTLLVYKKLAGDGVCHAQRQLGVMYEKGENVPQNLDKARHWYEQAAGQDYAAALCNLALLYLKGKGVTRDHDKGFELMRQGAVQGHARSQYYLAKMFEDGIGARQNTKEAITWFREAAKNSYTMAHKKLDFYGVDLFDTWQDITVLST